VLEKNPDVGPLTPWSQWGGADMDFNYAINVYVDACELAEARAAT